VTPCVLDTNVVSEPLRPEPSEAVLQWLVRQDSEALFLTTTVIGEIAFGIEDKRRKGGSCARLDRWLHRLIHEDFAGRILTYDLDAALLYGRMLAEARGSGRQPTVADIQIAAVARREGMAVATRDVRGFEPLGVAVIDPWRGA
jgi:toxin FitB